MASHGAVDWYEGGAGSTLVLLHGFSNTWRIWSPVIPMLEKHHRVIAPTLPGHIGGLPLTDRASPLHIFEVLARQLRERGITNAHFAGQSLGGWAVIEMVRLGLARSALGFAPGGAWIDEAEAATFLRKARRAYRLLPFLMPFLRLAVRPTALRKRVLAGEMQHGDRVSAEVAIGNFDRLSRMTIIREFLDQEIKPIEPLPADSKVPVRIAWGDSDKVLPFDRFGKPLLDLLGLDSCVMLEDCGHNPTYDDPEGTVKAILDFTRFVENGGTR